MKQYILTIYDNGTVRLSEHKVWAKRDRLGRFSSKNKKSVPVGYTVCPNCGTQLAVIKEVA